MSDLPAELRDELRGRLEEAKRGGASIPFDEAMAEAEEMADEIVAILNRAGARRSTADERARSAAYSSGGPATLSSIA